MLNVEAAAAALASGKVVAYPTEAVYGLGCDPMNAQAVASVWAMKQRPEGMGLIVVGSSWEQLVSFMAPLNGEQQAQLIASWPDSVTWVVPVASDAPAWLTGGRDTIALRWSKHSDVCALCDALGSAIVSTSANVHGQPPCLDADCVQTHLSHHANFAGVMAGDLGVASRPTPIRDLLTGAWIRS